MKNTKNQFLPVFLFVFLAVIGVKADTPQQILESAFNKMRNSSFACNISDQTILKEFRASKGKYFQLADGDFLYKKIMLVDDSGRLIACFVKNRKGSFAYINGKGGKIAAIPALDYVDNMTTSLSLPEQKLHTYSKRLTQVGKQKFHEIKIISTVDAEKIAAANKEMFLFYEGANKINSPVYAKRPMQRVYYVGVADGMVYFMQHFTHHKHLIREKEITNIDFDISLSANDFEADWEIHGDYIIFYDEYAAPALNKLYVSKLQINKDKTYYYNSLIVRSIDWILFPPNAKLISIGFFIIAAASTATLVFIRRKR
jgi:hypothetical protein